MSAERYTAETPAPEDWWAGPEVAPTAAALEDYTEADGVQALERLSSSLHTLNDALGETDLTVADAARYLAERLDMDALAGTIAIVQDLKRRLGLVESYVARQAGLAAVEMELPREGRLPDGRAWTLKRGNTRKGWDHEGWQGAVRRAVLDQHDLPPELVDPRDGEFVNLYELLADAQAVHGAQAPKVTALKALKIKPDEFCESTPGTWGLQVVAPSDTPTATTTDSGE